MSSNILSLLEIRNTLTATIGISFMVIGTLGGLLNILLFTRRHMWSLSPCIPYMFVASVANMFNLYTCVVIRVLYGFKFTFMFYFSAPCKLQYYSAYTSVCISSWLMAACCADRFIASSRDADIRCYSSMRIAYRVIFSIIIIIIMTASQVFFCFDANQVNTPGPCYTTSPTCAIIDQIYFFMFQLIGPPMCMIVFGIGTYIHIRQGRKVRPTDAHTKTIEASRVAGIIGNEQTRGKNRAVLRMLFAQILVYFLCTIPLTAFRLYAVMPITILKSNERAILENIIFNVTIFVQFGDKTFAFFIYTLTSAYFRQELVKLFKRRNI
ncbi:unnamed protein product [Adineta ricciae]|uniref:G-protein coupled receptors family 1 profile domain-containing protein n=1 Tax=Adineta ricciae TaxID=249248 RepID=A0A814D2Z9_ADIRI|nr:unnamed protein product [Adineta ricciae]CAF1266922.1 unnamed protein product [Adineta ricciae]